MSATNSIQNGTASLKMRLNNNLNDTQKKITNNNFTLTHSVYLNKNFEFGTVRGFFPTKCHCGSSHFYYLFDFIAFSIFVYANAILLNVYFWPIITSFQYFVQFIVEILENITKPCMFFICLFRGFRWQYF